MKRLCIDISEDVTPRAIFLAGQEIGNCRDIRDALQSTICPTCQSVGHLGATGHAIDCTKCDGSGWGGGIDPRW